MTILIGAAFVCLHELDLSMSFHDKLTYTTGILLLVYYMERIDTFRQASDVQGFARYRADEHRGARKAHNADITVVDAWVDFGQRQLLAVIGKPFY